MFRGHPDGDAVGYALLRDVPYIDERFRRFKEWIFKAAGHLPDKDFVPEQGEAGEIRIHTPVGIFAGRLQYVLEGGRLEGRVVFHKAPSPPFCSEWVPVFAIRIDTEGNVRYGDNVDGLRMESSMHGLWTAQELYRLGYQLMLASCTVPAR